MEGIIPENFVNLSLDKLTSQGTADLDLETPQEWKQVMGDNDVGGDSSDDDNENDGDDNAQIEEEDV